MKILPPWGRRFVALLSAAWLWGCGETTTPDPTPPLDSEAHLTVRPEGSARMAQRLALIADNAAPAASPFLNQERLAYLKSLPIPDDSEGKVRAELELAVELLRAGESAAAATLFLSVIEEVEKNASEHPEGLLHGLRSQLAVAYLRQGEQENCVEQHSIDACLMPIRDAGIHRLQNGSRAALAEYAALLEQDDQDLTSRWLYNLAAMTLGAYPHDVPEEWLIPPDRFASDHDLGRFLDVATGAGLDTLGLAGGSVVEDLDGDGLLDVMVSSWGLRDPLRYFRNQGDGSFEERTREAGLEGLTGGLNLIHADYDNDGDNDILVLRGGWLSRQGRHPNSLLANDGRGFFTDVTEEAGLLSFHPTQTAAWGDYDNDGWLDLFIGNESTSGETHPCELYRNRGRNADGLVTFEEVAAQEGLAIRGMVKGAVWGDIDNDGWLDLYVSRMRQEPNLLFHNQASRASAPSFVEIGSEAGVTEPLDSFPTWFFDADNDGWLDLFVAGYTTDFVDARASQVVADYLGQPVDSAIPRLYQNNRDGTFTDVTERAGLQRSLLAMGANFGDLDNDGYLDLYLGTGAPDFRVLVPNRMFRNSGDWQFQDVTTSGGFGHLQKGHGVSFADFDNDGDQDVFAVMGGAFSGDVYQNVLFNNPGHGARWLTLRLEGTTSNRSAIGARIRLEVETPTGRRALFRTVSTGGSFGSSSLQQEIGLGDALALPAVEVTWPGGGAQRFHDLPLDHTIRLREGDSQPIVLTPDRFEMHPGSHVHRSP